MIKEYTIGQIEHGKFSFMDAVVDADVFNGAFGEVTDGKFVAGAQKAMAIMQIEVGDDAGLAKYPIAKGAHVRVVDFAKAVGERVEIYDYPLPETFAVGDKFESDASGALVKADAPAGVYFEIEKIIGNKQGVVALIGDATV